VFFTFAEQNSVVFDAILREFLADVKTLTRFEFNEFFLRNISRHQEMLVTLEA